MRTAGLVQPIVETINQVGAVTGGGGLVEVALNDDRVNAALGEAVEEVSSVQAQQQRHGGLQPRVGLDVSVEEHVLQRSQQPSRVVQLAASDIALVVAELFDEFEEQPRPPPTAAQFAIQ